MIRTGSSAASGIALAGRLRSRSRLPRPASWPELIESLFAQIALPNWTQEANDLLADFGEAVGGRYDDGTRREVRGPSRRLFRQQIEGWSQGTRCLSPGVARPSKQAVSATRRVRPSKVQRLLILLSDYRIARANVYLDDDTGPSEVGDEPRALPCILVFGSYRPDRHTAEIEPQSVLRARNGADLLDECADCLIVGQTKGEESSRVAR